jgi:hypothetical protein
MELKFSKRDKFEAVELVRIHIRNKQGSDIVGRLLNWQMENEVYSERGGYSAPNGYMGFFEPDDAKKVIEWLKAQGIKNES